MAERPSHEFDPIDPLEHDLFRRVQAWSQQATTPEDPAAVVRVTTSAVRGRRSPGVPGGPGPWLAAVGLVTVIVVGGLVLSSVPPQTGQALPSPAGSLAAPLATGLGGVTTATAGPVETSTETLPPTAQATIAQPTAAPTATPVVTPKPTQKPPTKTPRPDPGPTDSWHTDWTPPPGFQGTFTASFTCTEPNGDHQVIYTAVFDSPVEVTTVEMFLDGDWFARGGPPVGDELVGEVIVGRYLPAGTTHSAFARFFTGPNNVDFIAARGTGTFTVPEGPLC